MKLTNKILVILIVVFTIVLVLKLKHFYKMREHRFDRIIKVISDKHGVDPFFVKAIIKRESDFDKDAVGTKGEIGLMQIMDGAITDWSRKNAKRTFSRHDFFNPTLNIEVGTWYIGQSLRQWENNPNKNYYALIQYNAGRANLLKWLKQKGKETSINELIDFPSTKKYVNKIMNYYDEYKEENQLFWEVETDAEVLFDENPTPK